MPHSTLTQPTHDLTTQQIQQPTLQVNDQPHSAHSWMHPGAPLGRINVIAQALAADPPETRWYELHQDDLHLRVVDRPMLLQQLLQHAEHLAPLVRSAWWLPSKTAQVAGYQPNLDTAAAIEAALHEHIWGMTAHRGIPLAGIAEVIDRPLLDTTVAAHHLVRTGAAVPWIPTGRSHMRLSLTR